MAQELPKTATEYTYKLCLQDIFTILNLIYKIDIVYIQI